MTELNPSELNRKSVRDYRFQQLNHDGSPALHIGGTPISLFHFGRVCDTLKSYLESQHDVKPAVVFLVCFESAHHWE